MPAAELTGLVGAAERRRPRSPIIVPLAHARWLTGGHGRTCGGKTAALIGGLDEAHGWQASGRYAMKAFLSVLFLCLGKIPLEALEDGVGP